MCELNILVGLFQVFFIRDGIKFPDMVHALKPNPKNHIQEDWRIADFFSHIPESMHMVSRQCLMHSLHFALPGSLPCLHLNWIHIVTDCVSVSVVHLPPR